MGIDDGGFRRGVSQIRLDQAQAYSSFEQMGSIGWKGRRVAPRDGEPNRLG